MPQRPHALWQLNLWAVVRVVDPAHLARIVPGDRGSALCVVSRLPGGCPSGCDDRSLPTEGKPSESISEGRGSHWSTAGAVLESRVCKRRLSGMRTARAGDGTSDRRAAHCRRRRIRFERGCSSIPDSMSRGIARPVRFLEFSRFRYERLSGGRRRTFVRRDVVRTLRRIVDEAQFAVYTLYFLSSQ